jgi:hypothetical protein
LRDKAREAMDKNIFNAKHHKEDPSEKKDTHKVSEPKDNWRKASKEEDIAPKEPTLVQANKKEENKPKMKKKAAPDVDIPITKDDSKPKREQEPTFDYMASQKSEDREEVKIEEESVPERRPERTTNTSASSSSSGVTNIAGAKIDKEHIKKGQEQLNSMVSLCF